MSPPMNDFAPLTRHPGEFTARWGLLAPRTILSGPTAEESSSRPGEYTVTFSLSGFQTVRREHIVLSASFTATVDATLPVGGVEQVVTVEGGAAGDRSRARARRSGR